MRRAFAQVLSSVLLLIVGLLAGCTEPEAKRSDKAQQVGPAAATDEKTQAAAERFLSTYVQDDGRVVRRDQGGDTVSEGQAYALLLAVGIDDEARFADVWRWTEDNLQRPDGLLSWQWRDGKVIDDQPASDADLDAARALILAASRFDDAGYLQDGNRLADAVLAHETIVTAAGKRHLAAGPWAVKNAPPMVNPSYFSPRAYELLASAGNAEQWQELRRDDTEKIGRLSADGLAPDWASVSDDGVFRAAAFPNGTPVQVSFDALRLPVRLAESCSQSDRALAAASRPRLSAASEGSVVLDRSGVPQGSLRHPLAYVAAAAASDAGQDSEETAALLDEAQAEDRANPTYYGAAWVALGRMTLTTERLGAC